MNYEFTREEYMGLELALETAEAKNNAFRAELNTRLREIDRLILKNRRLEEEISRHTATVPQEWREPMTEEDIDNAHDAAVKSYRRYQGAVRGQQMRPEDDFGWHLVREVERHHGIGIKEKSE